MRLGTLYQKVFNYKTLAVLATGGVVLLVTGCNEDTAGVFIDAMKAALNSAIPAFLDLVKEQMTNPGTTPGGMGDGGSNWFPTAMNDAVQTARILLA
jgi:hypothetical protein